ncbi:sensor histidine kinase [Lacticaseibacillus absianus]|uniref:sensor histidine kinase n=1 Tax=Lacticaseibacillus absianus TaxID=2729623 RepID=UPI0015CB47EE|nr:HAMP domain-containing sensor histidine kinase [Lacticaseibacillus absianus]
MQIILWGLLGLAALALTVLGLDLRRIGRELDYINTHETNAELTTSTRLPVFARLVAAINLNLVRTRQLRTQQVQQDARVHALLTNLTHDIKTPLTVASGYVQLMVKRTPADDQLVRVAHNLAIVNDYLRYLMDFNLIQEQNAQLTLVELDLSAFVEQCLFDAFDELQARGLTLAPALTPHIRLISDETLLRRVLDNLIGNWLKYAQGELRVTLDHDAQGRVQLTFSNETAAPLPPVERLTERFYTADRARRDSTGLGLSIVQALMVRLNGRLTLRTEQAWFIATLTFYGPADGA